MRLVLSLTFLLGTSYGQGDGVEWSGIFAIPTTTTSLTWRMQQVGGRYAKPSMKMVVLPTKNCTLANLDTLQETGWPAHQMSTTCPAQKAGATIKPSFNGCFNLTADSAARSSNFQIDVTGIPCIAVFTDHDPEYFQNDRHYLDAERIADEL